jgi:hypothetical protein
VATEALVASASKIKVDARRVPEIVLRRATIELVVDFCQYPVDLGRAKRNGLVNGDVKTAAGQHGEAIA